MKLFKAFLVLTLTTTIFVSSGIAAENTNLKLQESTISFNEDTPATAVQEFFYAFIKKDVAMFKKRITQETLKMMDDGAKEQNMKVDDGIKAYLNSEPFKIKRVPQMQKQKLNGDKCTIEAYLEGKWEIISLVKEDEIWRVDLMAMG